MKQARSVEGAEHEVLERVLLERLPPSFRHADVKRLGLFAQNLSHVLATRKKVPRVVAPGGHSLK